MFQKKNMSLYKSFHIANSKVIKSKVIAIENSWKWDARLKSLVEMNYQSIFFPPNVISENVSEKNISM